MRHIWYSFGDFRFVYLTFGLQAQVRSGWIGVCYCLPLNLDIFRLKCLFVVEIDISFNTDSSLSRLVHPNALGFFVKANKMASICLRLEFALPELLHPNSAPKFTQLREVGLLVSHLSHVG